MILFKLEILVFQVTDHVEFQGSTHWQNCSVCEPSENSAIGERGDTCVITEGHGEHARFPGSVFSIGCV